MEEVKEEEEEEEESQYDEKIVIRYRYALGKGSFHFVTSFAAAGL